MAQRTCEVVDTETGERCPNPMKYTSVGWCPVHYMRWYKTGDVQYKPRQNPIKLPRGLDPVARFWLRVDKDGPLPKWAPFLGPCWIWVTNGVSSPYGQYMVAGKPHKPYRFCYELVVGPVPEGKELDHLCRVSRCVRPDHLEPVSHRENTLRSPLGTCANNARKTHCKRGHEFTPENTYVQPSTGYRNCRECAQLRPSVLARKKADQC